MRVCQWLAEGQRARNKAFTAFAGDCGGAGGGSGSGESCAPMCMSDPADGTGVKSAVKCLRQRSTPGGSKRGAGSGVNRARFV